MRASMLAVGNIKRVVIAVVALFALFIATAGTRAQAPVPAPGAAQQPPQGAQPAGPQPGGPGRQGGPGGNQFAGQTPVHAMIVTGGCCHDYTGQSKVLMDTLNAVMPINWTVVQGMTALPDGRLLLYENSNWTRGFEIVIHNECWANGNLPAQLVQNITNAAVPRMFF